MNNRWTTVWIAFLITMILIIITIYFVTNPISNITDQNGVNETEAKENEPAFDASYTNTTSDEIVVMLPVSGQTVSSPLIVTGRARGSWYFEATAPVVLVDWDGKIIAEGYVTAQDDWMTEKFVPFTGTLPFTRPEYGDVGALILQASNPSGLSIYNRAVEIPLQFE